MPVSCDVVLVPPLGRELVIRDAQARTRCALAALDARLLDDIGITAQMADEEVRKAPWQR
jgi:hypothetical protein